ncbi:MAG: type IX secretion system protein PorQ [Bacteroidales bacterium]|nr:type IX secretion system protein PorQ [Bacteroidales bacterium]
MKRPIVRYISGRIALFFLLAFPGITLGQVGGDHIYQFLSLTASPRVASMGGDFLAILDRDISLALANPSLISPDMHNQLGVQFVDYFADINYGVASYSRTFPKTGSFVASMQYIDYGKFDLATETGERSGTFYAGESALYLGWGRSLDSSFSIGSSLKLIYSSLESYTSFGLAVDVAGSYHNARRDFTVSFIASDIGRQMKAYSASNIEPLPFQLRIGLSKKLKHLPFRYSVLYCHLEKWKIDFDDPADRNLDAITGEEVKRKGFEKTADNLMRHIVLGGELILSKNFSVRAGYNYMHRQELKLKSKLSTVGFSWGFGFRVSRFHFSYARSSYHLAGSPNYISVITDLGGLISGKD